MTAESTPQRGHLVQISVSAKGGVPKLRVAAAEIGSLGVVGDKQRDRRYHGGPDRAVCLYASERIAALQADGHPIAPGTTGENLTIGGLDWSALAVGSRLTIGQGVELEITAYAAPCKTIIASFRDGEFSRMSHKLHPGWSRLYARVLRAGQVCEGDVVALVGPQR